MDQLQHAPDDAHFKVSDAYDSQLAFKHKLQLERDNRSLLLEDLLSQSTYFRGGPYEAHVQFSNFCNMSCIMCWNGNNPPTQKTSPELLVKIAEQIGPHLSVITPYSGSEPLVLTWDETRKMAIDYGILLCITTNVQFLDEDKFHELKDIAETLILSIDSHIPETFEKIRPRGNSKKVFDNLRTTARLCLEHDLECIVNIVFMTDNAPHITETLEYLADLGIQNINVIQLLDVNGDSRFYDPLIHFSKEYVAWLKKNCIAKAKEKKIRLIWSISGYAEFDFRENDYVAENERKEWNDTWDLRMKRMFPGFCRNAYNRLRVDSTGDVAPCCYATQGELSLGNLNQDSFDEIWNSPTAQDLRRGMYTDDVPALCQSCRFHDVIEPQQELPFVKMLEQKHSDRFQTENETPTIPRIEILGPEHSARLSGPPEIRLRVPNAKPKQYFIAFSLGGESHETVLAEAHVANIQDEIVELRVDENTWNELRFNVGYWWTVWGVPANEGQKTIRCTQIQCVIRHQDQPRIDGSTLRYRNQGFVPFSDLGGDKETGWTDQRTLPDRPTVTLASETEKRSLVFPPTDHVPHSGIRGSQRSNRVHSVFPATDQSPNASSSKKANPITRAFLSFFGNSAPDTEMRKSIVLDGYLEKILQEPGGLEIRGWMLLQDGAADTIDLIAENENRVIASVLKRQDIADAFPELDSAINSGYQAFLPDELFWRKNHYEFTIQTKRGAQVVAQCRVKIPGFGNGETLKNGPFHIRDGTLEI